MITFDHFKINLLQANDAEAFFNLIDTNRVRLEDFFAGTVSKTHTLEDAMNYSIEIQQRIKNKSYLPYMIIDTRTNSFVGLVDLKRIDWSIPKAELGYFVDSKYSGQGITSKAVRLVVSFIIDTYQFKKLLCRVGTNNIASIKVALKNGFELEGTIRNDYRTTKGEIVDLNYYGRVF